MAPGHAVKLLNINEKKINLKQQMIMTHKL